MKVSVSIITSTIVLIKSSYFMDTAFATEEHHVHDSKISNTTTFVGVASLIPSLLIISKIIPAGKRLEPFIAPEGIDTVGTITKIIVLLVAVLIKQIVLKKEKLEVTA